MYLYLKKILSDVRFWIMLFFLIRLIGISNPPLEVSHNWRQVTTNMYARNFLEIDNNILYARVDHAGDLTGITTKEFPIYNYLIYLISLVFGFQHWYGRLISLLFGSLAIWFYYKIIRKYFDKKHAFVSSLLLICSSWFMFSRKIMPDIFSMSLVIMSMWYGLLFLYHKRKYALISYFLFAGLGILSKLPSIYLLSIFIIPFIDKSISLKSKLRFMLCSIVIIIATYLWYFKWMPYLQKTYGFTHFPLEPLNERLNQTFSSLNLIAKRFYYSAFVGYAGFLISIIGLFFSILNRNKKALIVFGIPTFFFLIFVIITGHNFYHHSYYIIPFVPVLAFIAGIFLAKFQKKWVLILILLIAGSESIINQHHDFKVPESKKYILSLEQIANQFTDKTDLIGINTGFNPQQLYFAHRKGWALHTDEILLPSVISKITNKGCKYLFVDKNYLKSIKTVNKPIIFENENYIIYQL